MTAWAPTATSFSLTLQNQDAALTGYLQFLQVEGYPLITSQSASVFDLVAPVSLTTSQALSQTFDFIADGQVVSVWAQQRLTAMAEQRPRPQIELVAKTPALTHTLLGMELSDRLVLVDDGAPWLSGLSGQFYVEHIALSIIPRQIVTATLQLFDREQGG